MRQAIVITNPKWEPFTSASDAFKSAGAPAVLVVRGRCKEKKPAKTIAAKTVKKVASALAVLLFCFAANAQQSIINQLTSTTIAGASTNYNVSSGVIGWNPGQVGVFQFTIIGTNATTGVAKLLLDISDNGTDWVTNQFTLTTTALGTNAATSISLLTNTVGGKYARIGSTINTNAAALTVLRLTVSMKEN